MARMSLIESQSATDIAQRRRTWILRGLLIAFIAAAVAVIWVSNIWLTQRFTETTRNGAELRLAIYSGTIQSELQRHSVVPLLLSRDPVLIRSLEQNSFTDTSQRLISYVDEIGAASLVLLDREGRIVAATDRERLGQSRSADPFFVQAARSPDTVFTANEPETGRFDFTFSRAVRDRRQSHAGGDPRRGRPCPHRGPMARHVRGRVPDQQPGRHHLVDRAALAGPHGGRGLGAARAAKRDPACDRGDGRFSPSASDGPISSEPRRSGSKTASRSVAGAS